MNIKFKLFILNLMMIIKFKLDNNKKKKLNQNKYFITMNLKDL